MMGYLRDEIAAAIRILHTFYGEGNDVNMCVCVCVDVRTLDNAFAKRGRKYANNCASASFECGFILIEVEMM